MINAITKFNAERQVQMKAVQNRLAAFSSMAEANVGDADKEIRKQFKALDDRAHTAKASLDAARAEMQKWADDSMSTITGWKNQLDVTMLAARADRAERYAAAASEVAAATVEAAAKAALEASRARADAKAAAIAKAA